MKQWLLYFFALVLVTAFVPFAAKEICSSEAEIKITLLSGSEVTELTAEDFALRLLLAEGEPLTHPESKKAFAIAARSLAADIAYRGYHHSDFHLCSDPDCCPRLADPQAAEEQYLQECLSAVESTRGLTLRRQGLPAAALYTYCAGSGTIAHRELSYLVSVTEPEKCEEHFTQLSISYQELQSAFPNLAGCSQSQLTENSVAVYDSLGKCSFCILNGEYFECEELKAALNLPSSEFSVTFGENELIFRCFGIGNGFGLSLCGAESMAKSGKTAQEIIAFYFPELELN